MKLIHHLTIILVLLLSDVLADPSNPPSLPEGCLGSATDIIRQAVIRYFNFNLNKKGFLSFPSNINIFVRRALHSSGTLSVSETASGTFGGVVATDVSSTSSIPELLTISSSTQGTFTFAFDVIFKDILLFCNSGHARPGNRPPGQEGKMT